MSCRSLAAWELEKRPGQTLPQQPETLTWSDAKGDAADRWHDALPIDVGVVKVAVLGTFFVPSTAPRGPCSKKTLTDSKNDALKLHTSRQQEAQPAPAKFKKHGPRPC